MIGTLSSHRLLNPMLKNIPEIHEIRGQFQSKTLTPKNKILNFQNFLSPSIITTYKHNGHNDKSRSFLFISFDFSLKIWYNTRILASRLTQIVVIRRKIDIFIFTFLQTAEKRF